jgi:hypothetical protein
MTIEPAQRRVPTPKESAGGAVSLPDQVDEIFCPDRRNIPRYEAIADQHCISEFHKTGGIIGMGKR